MSIQKDIMSVLEKYDEDKSSYDGFLLIGFANDGIAIVSKVDEPYKALGAISVVQKQFFDELLGE
jgi:hypothetical protein